MGAIEDALMTHWPEKPNPAKPYFDAAQRFAKGGISEVIGHHDPVGDLLQSDAANTAIGMATPFGAPEKIATAALRYRGKLYEGPVHTMALEKAASDHGMDIGQFIDQVNREAGKSEATNDLNGFVTSHGRFVSREEAKSIADKADQLHGLASQENNPRLSMEDVKLDDRPGFGVPFQPQSLQSDAANTAIGMAWPVGPELSSFRSIKTALDRGNWKLTLAGEKEGWLGATKRKTFAIEPNDIPEHWNRHETPGRLDRTIHYDPRFAEEYHDPDLGSRVRMKAGVNDEFPEQAEPGTIYRGMSWEDFQSGLQRGTFESRGEYNIGDSQKGLTFYSKNPGQAQSYAHGFAPWQYKATPSRPAVVIAVKDPGQYDQVVGESELGIREPISTSDIKDVYVGRPVLVRAGSQDFLSEYERPWTQSSGSGAGISTVWSRETPDFLGKQFDVLGTGPMSPDPLLGQ